MTHSVDSSEPSISYDRSMADQCISMAIVSRHPLMRLGIRDAIEFSDLTVDALEISSLDNLFDTNEHNHPFDVLVLCKYADDTELYSQLAYFLSKNDYSKTKVVILSDVLGCEDWDSINRGIVNVFLPMKVEMGLASYLIGLFLTQPRMGISECRQWTSLLSKNFAPDIRDLSMRELEVMSCLQHGVCNKIIAYELNMGLSTVKRHLTSVYKKLNFGDRTSAALEANRQGAVNPFVFGR